MTCRLQELRKEYGFSVADVAELSGISRSTIREIESGKKRFKTNLSVARVLSKALEVPVEELFEPSELSHIGRPALTGRPIENHFVTDEAEPSELEDMIPLQRTAEESFAPTPTRRGNICTIHYLEMTPSGVCTECC